MCISTAQARTNLTFPRHFIVILAEHCPCDMPMCLSTAQACAKRRSVVGRGLSPVKLLLTCPYAFRVRRSSVWVGRAAFFQNLVEILLYSFLRGPCMIQCRHRRFCGDSGEILFERSLREDLAGAIS